MTEPTPVPQVRRILPADITDQEYTDTIAEMQQELRDMGVPDELNHSGVQPQEDGTFLAIAWQARTPWDWEWPPAPPVAA